MILLILGLALWWAAHGLKIHAPDRRAALVAQAGEGPVKGGVAVLLLISLAMMILGYQSWYGPNLYFPPTWGVHLNNLLMLIAVGLLGASHSKGNAKRFVRHPMLWSVVLWGVSHLLVRGDLSAVVLFGGLAAWAVVSMLAINARDGAWVKPAKAPLKKDLILVGITVVAYGVFIGIHSIWLSPFPG